MTWWNYERPREEEKKWGEKIEERGMDDEDDGGGVRRKRRRATKGTHNQCVSWIISTMNHGPSHLTSMIGRWTTCWSWSNYATSSRRSRSIHGWRSIRTLLFLFFSFLFQSGHSFYSLSWVCSFLSFFSSSFPPLLLYSSLPFILYPHIILHHPHHFSCPS